MLSKAGSLVLTLLILFGASHTQVWQPDLQNGKYKNPIIFADYSDPDVVRAGDDYYMVASSFNAVPGLPVLHSGDLVNWELIGHVLPKLIPEAHFNTPQHGNGVWAPSIRYHNNEFYVFWGDPDFGIYMAKTDDPGGKWNEPVLVRAAKGWIDPCPFWDDDGNAYLVHAFAGSRSSRKSILVLHRMASDGTNLLDDGVIVFDGHQDNPTIEGPKMYKRDRYYYIFAPAGGVSHGWQTVLRSKNVFGPYEDKVVLHQGNTNINGPHQGGWVETRTGESWFIHFQDRVAYGRITHLNPIHWKDGWPMIGVDTNNDGIGEPVSEYDTPNVMNNNSKVVPQTSDEFDGLAPGPQWQWHSNPEPTWAFMGANMGFFRLYAADLPADYTNLWDVGNLFLQKLPAPAFTVTTKLVFNPREEGDRTGLIMMGQDYAYVAIEQQDSSLVITQRTCLGANDGKPEKTQDSENIATNNVYLRVRVQEAPEYPPCTFSYSTDGENFTPLGTTFLAKQGQWIGAKVGIFAIRTADYRDAAYADYDWVRFSANE